MLCFGRPQGSSGAGSSLEAQLGEDLHAGSLRVLAESASPRLGDTRSSFPQGGQDFSKNLLTSQRLIGHSRTTSVGLRHPSTSLWSRSPASLLRVGGHKGTKTWKWGHEAPFHVHPSHHLLNSPSPQTSRSVCFPSLHVMEPGTAVHPIFSGI